MICSVDGCTGRHLAKGFCRSHYERLRRHGDAILGRASPGDALSYLLAAVEAKTDVCILWPFAKTKAGYGKIVVDGKLVGAHAEALERSGHPKPSGRHVAAHAPQVCHQPACINPRHLRWALPDENMGDRVLDGTSNRGSRHGNSILNEDDVATIRNSNLSASDLAGRFGVSEATVRDVTTRRTWSHLK